MITGANRGLGLGYVNHYLNNGCNVIATYRNIDSSNVLVYLKEKYPDNLKLTTLDVSNEESIATLKAKLSNENIELSLVINNAGIAREEEFGGWTINNFENHFRVNTIGPALVSQAIIPFLEKGAKLIQISSGMGSLMWNINPENGLDAYAASKSALNSITIRLAEKLKTRNIGVFVINPGWVKTEMGGAEAPCTVDEAIIDITRTITQLKLERTGSFLSEKGEIIPW